MKYNFTDFLNDRLDEKLGNLNASNDPQYTFVLKAVLKNKQWRGDLVGPNSKIVTLVGKGRSQFIKDLRDVQKKISEPQLIFLTTEYKTLMIKNSDPQKYESDEVGFVPNPINANWQTSDIVVSDTHMGSVVKGPNLPKVEIEHNVTSAKGNYVIRRLKNSLDNVALYDDTEYHAIVILPDLSNVGKAAQRRQNSNVYSYDKYLKDPFSGKTDFMVSAELNAERLKKVKHRIFKTSSMTMKDAHRMLALTGDDADNIVIDGEMFIKNYNIYKDAKVFVNTQAGIMYLCQLMPRAYNNKKWQKEAILTYDMKSDKFELVEDSYNFEFV